MTTIIYNKRGLVYLKLESNETIHYYLNKINVEIFQESIFF